MSAEPAETPIVEVEDAPVVRLAYQSYEQRETKPSRRLNISALVTGLKALAVIALMAAYPTLIMLNHKLDDTPVSLDEGRHWAAADAGIASTLITRELDGPGWVGDKHRWHPQVRLTALPAWQDGLIEAIADHGRMSLSLFEGQKDPDLVAAMRLLGRTTEEKTEPRLIAAREALMRYDGRVGVGLAGRPEGTDALIAELALAIDWASEASTMLGEVASPGDGWIASRHAIETVYNGKARAHVAHEMLAARATREQGLFVSEGAERAFNTALSKWRIAAKLRPLFIANQGGDALIGTNHPAMLAFLLTDAAAASQIAITALQTVPADESAL